MRRRLHIGHARVGALERVPEVMSSCCSMMHVRSTATSHVRSTMRCVVSVRLVRCTACELLLLFVSLCVVMFGVFVFFFFFFFFSSRRRHTRCLSDWSSDVCSSDLLGHTNR